MIAVANAGYRAIAFDFRGYGLSEHPAEPEKATLMDLVDEVVGLLDSLGITKVSIKMCCYYTIKFYLVCFLYFFNMHDFLDIYSEFYVHKSQKKKNLSPKFPYPNYMLQLRYKQHPKTHIVS